MKMLLVNEKQNSCQSAAGVYRARQRIIYQSNSIKGKIKGILAPRQREGEMTGHLCRGGRNVLHLSWRSLHKSARRSTAELRYTISRG